MVMMIPVCLNLERIDNNICVPSARYEIRDARYEIRVTSTMKSTS